MNSHSVPLNRRRFVLASAAAAATTAVSGIGCAGLTSKPASKALVGTQLYGWGQYYDRAGKRLDEHLDEALKQIRDGGFDYAEGTLNVAQPEQNAGFAERLRRANLVPSTLYTGGTFHVAGQATQTAQNIFRAAQAAKAAGFTGLVCNPDPIGREKTDAELETQVAALAVLGKELHGIGMALGLHHHTPELRSNGREFHFNFKRTSAETVGFCYDVHWVYRGGIPPADALRDYGTRIVSWHLRQSRNQIWWEDLAPGDIDYGAVAAYAKSHGLATRLTVELALENGTQITRSAAENHQRSREFVRQTFGV